MTIPALVRMTRLNELDKEVSDGLAERMLRNRRRRERLIADDYGPTRTVADFKRELDRDF